MWNMDEKGFTIGTANRAKVTACADSRLPRAIHNGTRDLITVTECCGARLKILVPMVVFTGTIHYPGWYTEAAKDTPGRLFQPTLKVPGALPALFHTIQMLFWRSFQATKSSGLFLKSALPLEHSSFSKPLPIVENFSSRLLALL